MKSIRRLIHATDFSRASGRALTSAMQIAKRNKAELLLLHVIEPITPYLAPDQYAGPELYVELIVPDEESKKSQSEG
jgi:nucleotide-binding universal stress UspA family protein